MSRPHQLKSLNVKLRQLEEEKTDGRRRIKEIEREAKSVRREIETLKDRTPVVSEHAMLRYLERVKEIDLVEVKKAIIDPDMIEKVKVLGDGKYPRPGGFSVLVKDGVITSVVVPPKKK